MEEFKFFQECIIAEKVIELMKEEIIFLNRELSTHDYYMDNAYRWTNGISRDKNKPWIKKYFYNKAREELLNKE